MKLNLKKYCYLIALVIFSIINDLHQVSGMETTSSSGQFSIPVCSSCNSASESEPTCSGTTSPQCSIAEDKPSCELVGDICTPSCPGTSLDPNTGFSIPATPFCNTKYLITDGLGAGIQIYSVSDNPSKILISTITGGSIKEPDEKCLGPSSHFNGYLLNYSDPEPDRCGWGHVVIFKKLPERLSLVSEIITSTEHAHYYTESISGDFGTALIEINNYSIKLKTLKDLIVKSKDIKSVKRKMILRKIELTLKSTEVAKSNLSNLTNAQNSSHTAEVDPSQRDAARTALSKAQDAEVEIFKILLKFDRIL